MLTMNYVAMQQGTAKPVPSKQVVAKTKRWDWNKKHSRAGPCIVTTFALSPKAKE